MEKFIFLEHLADIKFKAFGKNLNEAFENTVLAVSHYLSQDKKVKLNKKKIIEITADNNESLLYNFVDDLIYLLDAEKFIPGKAKVTITGFNLKAEIQGDDSKDYDIKQIKAATFAEMHIKQSKQGFEVQMVLDV